MVYSTQAGHRFWPSWRHWDVEMPQLTRVALIVATLVVWRGSAMAAEPPAEEQWRELPLEPIIEAFSFIEQASVMQPLRYSLECALHGDTLELSVEADVVAKMTKDAARLPLLLSGGLRVVKASVDGEPRTTERSGDKLWLLVGRSRSAGSTVTCHFLYRGRLPSAYVLREATGTWAELAPQAFWYPFAFWDVTSAIPFRLSLDLPEGMVAVSNGSALDEKQTASGTRYVWSSSGEDPGIAVLAGPYAARQTSCGDLKVRTFVRPDMAEQADGIATMLGRLTAFYIERFGPTAAGEITVVVPPHSVGGNWALSRMIVAGQLSPQSDRARRFGILAHEGAHQWWGHAVRFDFGSALWLVEGLTAFSELSARLRLEGEHATREHVAQWTLPRYATAREAKVALAECRSETPYSQELREDASAMFLALLRQRMGGAEFDRRLKAFFAAYAGRTASSADFVHAMTDGAAEPLLTFVREWLYDPALPEVHAEDVVAGLR